MGRDFRSSFGAGLDSGFDSDLSAMDVGFDSGFDSGLSGFDVTMVVLLFLLPTPGAGPEKAWNFAGMALRKVHRGLLKMGSAAPRKFNELTPDLCTPQSS
jgi:hypothetical protein